MLSGLYNWILGLPAAAVLIIVFLVPAAEASMFLGFIFPGEIAIILGGVLANEHVLPLWSVILVGSLGSIVGDSVGYRVGQRYGTAILRNVPHRVIKPEHIERGKELLRRRGGQAVFIGRFTVALRVLIPGMAGASGLPYRKFLTYNVLGGVAWATETAIFGYLAGRGYRAAEHRMTQVSVLILTLLILAFLVTAIRRRRRSQTPAAPTGVGWRGWLADRLRPHAQLGLGLTLAAAGVVGFGWTFGGLLEDVSDNGGVALRDPAILNAILSHRTPDLTQAAHVASFLGSSPLVYALLAAVGLGIWVRRKHWFPLIFSLSVLASGQLVRFTVAALIGRQRPPVAHWLGAAAGSSFPSGHTTVATIGYGMLAYLIYRLTKQRWQRAAAIIIAILLAAAVGTSRAYLGVHWPSDVLAGWSLGGLWLALSLGGTYVWRNGSTLPPSPPDRHRNS